MITATRLAARELEDGTLEVVLHVHGQHKPEFFAVFPRAGAWVSLCAAEKPPTQGAAASSTEAPPPPMASAGGRSEVVGLVKSPWFQEFAATMEGATYVGDAERLAEIYISKRATGIGGMLNAQLLAEVVNEFRAWCEIKGYRQDA